MKYFILLLTLSIYLQFNTLGQVFESTKPLDPQIKEYLNEIKRDSSDKTCQQLLSDFYYCFESDSGQANPQMVNAMMNLLKYYADPNLPNRQLVVLLYEYLNSVDKPEQALNWIRTLKDEYKNIYGNTHPLIYLYEGESLINNKQSSKAYEHFKEFQKVYPESVVAMCYIYETEPNRNLKKTWLSFLKAEHPNHWIVKKYKE
jgi:hypothetical protein